MNIGHTHFFQGSTSVEFSHLHRYNGQTGEAQNIPGHVHEIAGITSKDNGHTHSFRLTTGPSIDVPGGHIHAYQGLTTSNLRHRHSLAGNTAVYILATTCLPVPRSSFTAEEARVIGSQLGIDWSKSPFDLEQFRTGLDVELEHGQRSPITNVTNDDPITTGKIALAHLNEFPDYYTRLTKLEKEAKAYWKK